MIFAVVFVGSNPPGDGHSEPLTGQLQKIRRGILAIGLDITERKKNEEGATVLRLLLPSLTSPENGLCGLFDHVHIFLILQRKLAAKVF